MTFVNQLTKFLGMLTWEELGTELRKYLGKVYVNQAPGPLGS